MNWFKVKLDRADIEFSKYIRLRDGKCVRCGRRGTGELGITGLQAAHFHSRRKESVRFDPLNVDAVCGGCHRIFAGPQIPEHWDFKINQLGEREFDLLQLRAETPGKKDRKMALMVARQLLKEVRG